MSARGAEGHTQPTRVASAHLPRGLRDALLTFESAVGGDIPWAVDGSTALALQGIDLVPEDIDILTDREGAYAIGHRLKEFVVRPVAYGRTQRYSSHFGTLSMRGVRIDVMGNLKTFRNGKWTKTQNPSSVKLRRVAVGERLIPVVSLDSLSGTGYFEERLRRSRGRGARRP